MTLLKLAEEFKVQMESCRQTKSEAATAGRSKAIREYWAGKEQAWYEAWRTVVILIDEGS